MLKVLLFDFIHHLSLERALKMKYEVNKSFWGPQGEGGRYSL